MVYSDIKSYVGNEPYVFVSYSHHDDEITGILKLLKENDIRFWYDEGIKTGEKWLKEITDRINNCTVFLVFISKNALESENVKDELYYAKSKKKKMLIVHLDDTVPDDEFQLSFDRIQKIYKNNYETEDLFYKKLLNSIDISTVEKKNNVNDAFEELSRRYEITGNIYNRSFSSNFVARDKKTDAKVFIKHVSFNKSYYGELRNTMVRNELYVLKCLHNCPFCAHLLDYYEDEKNIFLVESYVEGEMLSSVIENNEVMEVDRVMSIAVEVAEILCIFYLMTPQVAYLDIKPDHIVIPTTGHLCFIDFGISRLIGEKIPNGYKGLQTSMGTKGYAAPEQYDRNPDTRADIYSLGAMMLSMIFKKNNMVIPISKLKDYYPQIPEVVTDIILKAIEPDPEKRYQTPMEMLYDLYRYKEVDSFMKRYADVMPKRHEVSETDRLITSDQNSQVNAQMPFYMQGDTASLESAYLDPNDVFEITAILDQETGLLPDSLQAKNN